MAQSDAAGSLIMTLRNGPGTQRHIQWGGMAFVLSELCARPHSPECDRAWDCVTTVYDAWKTSGDQEDKSRLALWRPIRQLMAKVRYVREIQRTDRRRPVQAERRAQYYDPVPCPPAAEFLSHYPETPHTNTCVYHANARTLVVCVFPGPNSKTSGTLQGLLGTETLSPFIDFIPDRPRADGDGDIGPLFPGIDLELPSRLS
ncbi:hypothetical protein HAV15_009399 [Penicillium sp. str. |nr:hypothetical protein HAV15_009399 [Penicillium sp. str. \